MAFWVSYNFSPITQNKAFKNKGQQTVLWYHTCIMDCLCPHVHACGKCTHLFSLSLSAKEERNDLAIPAHLAHFPHHLRVNNFRSTFLESLPCWKFNKVVYYLPQQIQIPWPNFFFLCFVHMFRKYTCTTLKRTTQFTVFHIHGGSHRLEQNTLKRSLGSSK